MPTKVLDLELSEPIAPIWAGEEFDSFWIFVRDRGQLVGRVRLSADQSNFPVLSSDRIQHAILEQLGQNILQMATQQQLTEPTPPVQEPISVVVCTRNRTGQLKRCLRSLTALDYPTYEVIVVDNAPSDDSTYQLVKELPVRYVREDRPGLDWARNRGLTEARYGIVAFTDDDVQVDRHWLSAIATAFTNPEVMAVSGYVAPAELETLPQFLFEFDYGGMGHGLHRRLIRRDLLSDRQLLWSSSFGIGANMAFRRDLFTRIAPFDPALDVGTPSGGAGDVELFHRLVAQGYTMLYEPNMLVWHTHRRYFSGLKQQIYDNGRSFGCYLLTCFREGTVSWLAIVYFFLWDWLCKWILVRLVRPPRRLPRGLVLTELAGMLSSPFAYLATQARARQVARLSQVPETAASTIQVAS
ncbi:glycosyltransferase [Leptolyngbya sp. FACHB-17]|uniref:glycosyltransferase n=1 Tax=unclassified Leptolyngbya TaxID=2650499 RepID=UPI001680678D|nr:glycosyltransferase [Leptolyngbya sp. FACHB-17]MBD2081284.1 glycosyltransferase [Leptolyngbya sp. FACHB-17]